MLTISTTALLALVAPQDPPDTFTMLPIQHLLSDKVEARALPYGSMLHPKETFNSIAGKSTTGLSVTVDDINQMLSRAFDDESNDGGLYLDLVGNNVLAAGKEQHIRDVKDLLTQIARTMSRPIEVEFAAWDASDLATPAAILDREAYAEFAANRTPIWRVTNRTIAGRLTSLEHIKESLYLRGINTEVASKSTMLSPETSRYLEGGSAAVQAFSLIGTTDLVVHLQFAASALLGVVDSLQTGMPDAPDIELPQLNSFFGTCSGRIPNHGALTATMIGDPSTGGQLTLTMRVSSHEDAAPPAAAADQQGLTIWPIGALTTEGLSSAISPPEQLLELHSHRLSQRAIKVHGHIPDETLRRLIEDSLNNEEEVFQRGGYITLSEQNPNFAHVRKLVIAMQDRMTQNAQIEHRSDLKPNQRSGEQANPPPLYALTIPTIIGRTASACRIRETNVVSDIHCEIAQEAGTLRPIISLLQSGTWLNAYASPIGESVHLNMETLSATALVPRKRRIMPGGVIMLAKSRSARNSYDSPAVPGLAINHGEGPSLTIDGNERKSSITTTISR
jgi:hypothetical protein